MTPKTTLLKRGSAHFHRPGDRTDLFLNQCNQLWRSANPGNFLSQTCVQLVSGVMGATGSLASSSVSHKSMATQLWPAYHLLFTAWHARPALTTSTTTTSLSSSSSSSSLDTLSHPSPCKSTKVRYIPKATEAMVTLALKGVREMSEKMWRGGVGYRNSCEVRVMNKEEGTRNKNRQTNRCYPFSGPCYWHGCICLWIYPVCLYILFWVLAGRVSLVCSLPLSSRWRREHSFLRTSYPSDQQYQHTQQEEMTELCGDFIMSHVLVNPQNSTNKPLDFWESLLMWAWWCCWLCCVFIYMRFLHLSSTTTTSTHW